MVEYAIDVRGFELRVRSAADGAEINGNGTVRVQLAADKCVAIAQTNGVQSDEKPAV